ncbi:MAG: cell division protein ZapE [Proteobacteria bacterium]|nr:cell division protein ZapE [Pseudomonadota bacterium]
MGFYQFFSKVIKEKGLLIDDSQDFCSQKMDVYHQQFLNKQNFIKKIIHFFLKPQKSFGIYLFGPVGSGKTMMMDLYFTFFKGKKVRDHFKTFMLNLQRKGFDETINHFKSYEAIFLDELEIIDIADALIIKRLFFELAKNDVQFILTSNLKPCDLYKGGLHFERFEPFIPFLNKNFIHIEVNNGIDYRLIKNQKSENVIKNNPVYNQKHSLIVLDKVIPFKVIDTQEAFSFKDICEEALGPVHYHELASLKNKILLVDVPKHFTNEQADSLRRLITLVDLFYDQKKGLKIHPSSVLTFDEDIQLPFQRLQSRLIEMS